MGVSNPGYEKYVPCLPRKILDTLNEINCGPTINGTLRIPSATPSTAKNTLITVTNDELISSVPAISYPEAPGDSHQEAFNSPAAKISFNCIKKHDMSPQGLHRHKSELRDGDSLSSMLTNLHLTRTPTRSNIAASRLFHPSDKIPIASLPSLAVSFEIGQGVNGKQLKKTPRKTQRVGVPEPRRRVLVPIDGSHKVLATAVAVLSATTSARTSAAVSQTGDADVQKDIPFLSTSSVITLPATSPDDDITLPGTSKKRVWDKAESDLCAVCDAEHEHKVEMLES